MKFVGTSIWRNSFSLRLFGYFFAALVVVIILFDGVFYQWQKTSLQEDLLAEGRTLAEILAHSSALGVFAENPEQLVTPVEAVSRHRDVQAVTVLTLEGKLLHRQAGFPASGEPESRHRPIPELLRPAEAEEQLGAFRETAHSLEFWEPVRLGSTIFSQEALYFDETSDPADETAETIGYVGVVLSKERLEAGFEEIWRQSIGLALVFLLIGLLLTFLICREVTKPLKRLTSRIKAQGDLPPEVGDELTMLEGTYDSLIVNLTAAFETIKRLNADLEKKVETRTRELSQANAELSERENFLTASNQRLESTLQELRETQVQLVQSEKMAALGQLVAGMAHEINNTTNFVSGALPPLHRILGELRRMLTSYEKLSSLAPDRWPAELAEIEADKTRMRLPKRLQDLEVLLANIREGVKRTSQIVSNLKNFARPDSGESKPTRIHDCLDSTLALLHQEAKDRIDILREYDPELPLITCSANLLNQVFMNILLNAIQAIEGRGEIRIRTGTMDRYLLISISDSGSGIPTEVQERIFDPFFTTKEVGKGTGLGLSISYNIVKEHGGVIRVFSNGVDQGSRFEILLPLNKTEGGQSGWSLSE